MARSIKLPGHDERLVAFARRLNSFMLAKNWNAADLAQEATKHAPRGTVIGRHLTAAWLRAENEPSEKYLGYVAKALGKTPDDLLAPLGGTKDSRRFATATSTLDGTTRLIVDTEVDAETAQKVLALLRNAAGKKSAA